MKLIKISKGELVGALILVVALTTIMNMLILVLLIDFKSEPLKQDLCNIIDIVDRFETKHGLSIDRRESFSKKYKKYRCEPR